jgi:hypothetical protein
MSLQEISPEDQAVENARGQVAHAIMALSYLTDPGQASIENTVALAIRSVMSAVMNVPNLHDVMPDRAKTAAEMFEVACPVVAEAVERIMPPEKVYFMMGAVGGLLRPDLDGFLVDRYDYAGAFAARLALAHHDRSLAKRGEPLLRAIRIQRALDEPMPTDGQLS